MRGLTCFDVVEMVMEDATVQFAPLTVDVDRLAELKDLCEKMDQLTTELQAESFEVEIDEVTTEIAMSVICEEFEISKTSVLISAILNQVQEFQVRAKKLEQLCLEFRVKGIWGHES